MSSSSSSLPRTLLRFVTLSKQCVFFFAKNPAHVCQTANSVSAVLPRNLLRYVTLSKQYVFFFAKNPAQVFQIANTTFLLSCQEVCSSTS